MRTAYKCRAYPDPDQQAILARTFGSVRVVWNRTLAARDLNAARNILAAGRAVAACGADVSHPGSFRVQSAVKQEPSPATERILVPAGEE